MLHRSLYFLLAIVLSVYIEYFPCSVVVLGVRQKHRREVFFPDRVKGGLHFSFCVCVYVCVFLSECVGSCACACNCQRSHVFDPVTAPMSTFISCPRDDVKVNARTFYLQERENNRRKTGNFNQLIAILQYLSLSSLSFLVFPPKVR